MESTMQRTIGVSFLAALALVACSDSSSKGKSAPLDGAAQDAVSATTDGPSTAFSVAGCQADTCGAEAAKCGWGSSDAKYLGCLGDCVLLGAAYLSCPAEVTTLYTCASLGAKVDCTTGKGTGCSAEEAALAPCIPKSDAGR
jgi:hypothetical protein